jgi:beta-galactosidase
MSFERAWAALILATSILSGVAASATSPKEVKAIDVRQTQQLSVGGRFYFGDDANRVTAADFDDSGWEVVSIPHTWNRLGETSLLRTEATNNQRGRDWYRLTFEAQPRVRDQRPFCNSMVLARSQPCG